jgi:hypothetical protein
LPNTVNQVAFEQLADDLSFFVKDMAALVYFEAFEDRDRRQRRPRF